MKKTIFFILILGFQCMKIFGQSSNDSIIISKAGGDIKCYKNGILLNDLDYNFIFKNNTAALHEMKIARSDYKAGMIFGYAGGFLVGFCLGSAISGQKIDYTWWWTVGSGAAIVGTALLIYSSGKKHHRNAVSIYNSSLGTSGYNGEHALEFGLSNNGLGFVYKF